MNAPNFSPQQGQQAQSGTNHQGSQPAMMAPPAPLMPDQITPGMINFASDPAFAAAATTSLFPNPAMLNNASAFFAMPQMFSSQGMNTALASASGRLEVPTRTAAPTPTASSQPMPTGFHPSLLQPVVNHSTLSQPVFASSGGFQSPLIPLPTGVPSDVVVPPPNSSSAVQVQLAAAAAAAAAVPRKMTGGGGSSDQRSDGSSSLNGKVKSGLTAAQKAKLNRDRNREHARSTRLRKKAYVQKLKELVEGLHADRTEEARKRRVAIQHLSEKQNVRRAVVHSFLRFHSSFESDPRKWMTILEDGFWFKQPVTPFRSFRRTEIEQECRVSRGIDAVIADAASLSVMVEGIGSRSSRWMQIKREDVTNGETSGMAAARLPRSIMQQNNRYRHAISSLSSSSGSSHGSAGEECRRHLKRPHSSTMQSNTAASQQQAETAAQTTNSSTSKKVSSSGSSNDSGDQQKSSNEFHVYNAPSLPDPKLGDSDGSSPDDSQGELNNIGGAEDGGMKQVSTDSSSGEEDKLSDDAVKTSYHMRHKVTGSVATSSVAAAEVSESEVPRRMSPLPLNIAKSGGIQHNIRPAATHARIGNGRGGLDLAPPVKLPPFLGLGKRAQATAAATEVTTPATAQGVPPSQPEMSGMTQPRLAAAPICAETLSSLSRPEGETSRDELSKSQLGPTLISGDVDGSSSNSSSQSGQIRAFYHVNEDDMLLTDDVLMCPFIFRSQDAVMCGALAECIMPGMLRAHFSPRNKLLSLEMVYDAMGFMQQLERASGSEGAAQIVPGSLEMALSPHASEARVIAMAKPPHLIVSVNEAWTRMTKYTQMEVEGRDLSFLNGVKTDSDAALRPGKPPHTFGDVAQGKCASSTIIHYDKNGREFVNYVCSYPLTNTHDEITHILHVHKELPMPSLLHDTRSPMS